MPYTNGRVGLLSTQGLQSMLASSWLVERLAPHRDSIEKWSIILFFWCLAGTFLLTKLGLLNRHGSPPRPGLAILMILFLFGPAVAAFTLNLVAMLASGSLPSRALLSDESLRAQLAWVHSMLVTAVGLLALLGLAVIVAVLRAVGIVPDPDQRGEASADEAST